MNTTDSKKKRILEKLKNGLIVSCQVHHDDPIYTDNIAVKMAEAAKWAGANGIRANSPEQIRAIKAAVDLPLIGLYKIWNENTNVFITPTLESAMQIFEAGAEIIALDCTEQEFRGKKAYELLPQIKREIPDAIIFADVSNYEEAKRAADMGADMVAPTLYGYTEKTSHIEHPDLREFARMCRDLGNKTCMVMEGHIYTPEDAIKCLYLGAYAVVVGSAITRPHLIAKRFVDLMGGYQDNWRKAELSKH